MLALFLCVALQSFAPHGGVDRGTVQWDGYVERVTPLPDGSGVTITLRAGDAGTPHRGPDQTVVRFPDIPRAYKAALARAPSRVLTESMTGRLARIHAYVDERGTQVAAVETRPPDGGPAYRLDYVTPYFDLTADKRAIHEYSLAAAVLSQHPDDMRHGMTIWVRDLVKNTRFSYERAMQAADMIHRFGDATMNGDVPTIQRIRREHGDRIGLISLQPFVPKAPGDRFVGWWGGFPVEIYVDTGSEPMRLFSRNPRQKPGRP